MVQAKEADEAKQRHAMELRRQIEAAEARAAQKRAAARSEGADARAAEAARQALVEVSHQADAIADLNTRMPVYTYFRPDQLSR